MKISKVISMSIYCKKGSSHTDRVWHEKRKGPLMSVTQFIYPKTVHLPLLSPHNILLKFLTQLSEFIGPLFIPTYDPLTV